MNPHELKQLQTRQAKARALVDEARRINRNSLDNLNRAEKELRDVGVLIAEAQRNFTVSEHAILRYAERVMGLDVPLIVATITQEVGKAAEQLGNGKFPLCGNFKAVVKDKTVITIEPS